MQATVETISALERRITVAVPMQPIEEEVSQRLSKLARTVKLSGFRPGKVPMKLVQQQYGPSVRQEVISNTVERTFGDAVEQNKLKVAGYPNIEHKPTANADQLEYIATFEVYPEIVIGDFAAVAIERPALQVSEAEVDKTIEVLRKQRALFEPVKRAAKKGDKVNITFRAEMEGKEVEGTNGQGIDLVLGEGGRIADFDDNIVGSKAGAIKKFEIAYAQDFANPELAGKTVSYEVTLNSVANQKLPEVDAEFARELGVEDGDVAKMRAEIRESLEQEVAKRVRARLKEQVFQSLLENVSVELPRSLVALEINRLMQAAHDNLQSRGVDLNAVTLEPMHFEEQAQRHVKLRLILAEVVTKNELHAKPEQVRAMVEDFAKSFEDPAEVVRWYHADPQRMNEPVGMATEENVVNWVLERAKVKEKKIAFDELMGNA
ncbi:MAG: trigger factor [Rhodocyclaceae bacterium]|nr:MAG: trigger factor [Rhodocyclaceae bacterium]